MQTTCILVVSKNETLTQVLKELLPNFSHITLLLLGCFHLIRLNA